MKSLLCGAVLDRCFYCTYFDMLISFKVCFSVHCFSWRLLFYIFLILFQYFYHGWNNLLDFYFTAMLRKGGRDWAFKMKILYIVGVGTDQTVVPLIPCRCNLSYIHLGSSVCHPVCHPVCRPVVVAERWLILYVLAIKLTKDTRRRVSKEWD